jgi:hypothetical protein
MYRAEELSQLSRRGGNGTRTTENEESRLAKDILSYRAGERLKWPKIYNSSLVQQ